MLALQLALASRLAIKLLILVDTFIQSILQYRAYHAYIFSMGGPSGNQAPNPGNVNVILYQLSYSGPLVSLLAAGYTLLPTGQIYFKHMGFGHHHENTTQWIQE